MLRLEGVTAGYGSHVVLRDVALDVPREAVVALLGANGAGKTTTLRVAAGLLRPTNGRVVIDGRDVSSAAPEARAQAGICLVPEGRGVFGSLTVKENLRLMTPAEAGASRTEAVLEAFPRLEERLDQKAGTMSGGEQQMLALASAYVSHAPFVLLDEVSMGLAPMIIDEIFEHLVRLRELGASLLLVEQYVARALEIADYVYILDRGRITFAGEAGELDEASLEASYLGGVAT